LLLLLLLLTELRIGAMNACINILATTPLPSTTSTTLLRSPVSSQVSVGVLLLPSLLCFTSAAALLEGVLVLPCAPGRLLLLLLLLPVVVVAFAGVVADLAELPEAVLLLASPEASLSWLPATANPIPASAK
jgi:hypothetical protein